MYTAKFWKNFCNRTSQPFKVSSKNKKKTKNICSWFHQSLDQRWQICEATLPQNLKWPWPCLGMRLEVECFLDNLWSLLPIKIIPSHWRFVCSKTPVHIFGVSKQIGLAYKYAISGEATLINFCFQPGRALPHWLRR